MIQKSARRHLREFRKGARVFFNPDNDAVSPSREFLRNLFGLLKSNLSEHEFQKAVKKARAKAGGTMSGRSRKRKKEEEELEELNANNTPVGDTLVDPRKKHKDNEAVQYRESDVDVEQARANLIPLEDQVRCGTCAFYQFGRCQLVEGDIDAFYTCSLYEQPSKTFHDLVSFCDAEFGESHLFFEVSAPADKTWIPYLPKPGQYKHPKYGTIGLSQERNAHFVDQFDKRVYGQNLPIDIEHDPETLKNPGPMGYATKMRQNKDGSVDAHIEWTDVGLKMMETGRYRYFSPQWREVWADSKGVVHTDVAVGGALTARPFFKEKHLRPLVASELI